MGNCIFVFPQETLLELLHSLAKLLPYFCPQKTLFFWQTYILVVLPLLTQSFSGELKPC